MSLHFPTTAPDPFTRTGLPDKAYTEHLPPSSLTPFIECIWTMTSDRDNVQWVTPDGCVDILLRRQRARCQTEVIGTMTRAHRVAVVAGTQFVGVRFRPGMALSVLPMDGESLADKTIALDAIWRGNAEVLEKKLLQAESAEELGFLLERLLVFGHAVPRAQRGIGLIVERHGQVSLDEVYDTAHLGDRQFRRYCLSRTGLTPKMLARIVRFRHAGRRLDQEAQVSLSQLAVDAGYFDQAHMIRDFRAFAGNTPARLRAARRSPNFPIR